MGVLDFLAETFETKDNDQGWNPKGTGYNDAGSLAMRVNQYITQGGRPEYQTATEHPKTLAVYNEPYAKQNGAQLGTFEYYINDNGTFTKGAASTSIRDPFLNAADYIEKTIRYQAPKFRVDGGNIVVTAPKEVLNSPLVAQMKESVKTVFNGADLSNPEVQKAIESLNKEVSTNIENYMVQESFGWTPEQLKDYRYAMQTTKTTNPLKSPNKIKGMTKDGKIVEKTPQEWHDYYREVYNTDERTNAFEASMMASNPYERTMYLVMSGGGNSNRTPINGFDTGERIKQGVHAAWNQFSKLWENYAQDVVGTMESDWAKEWAKEKDVPLSSFSELDYADNDALRADVDSMKKKTWKDMNNKERALSIALMTSKSGYSSDPSEENLSKLKQHVDTLKRSTDFQADLDRNDVQLAKNASWSGSEQGLGNMAGYLSRIYAEHVLMKKATGGKVNMAGISDNFANKIMYQLHSHGLVPTSPLAQKTLSLGLRVAGSVPEDIIQTAVDNYVTGNPEENEHLFDPSSMSDSARSNFFLLLMFDIGKAGFSSLKSFKMAKDAAKQLDLDTKIDLEGVVTDVDDINRAIKNGGKIEVDGNTVRVDDPVNGSKVLNNITPEQGKMVQKTLFDVDAEAPITKKDVGTDADMDTTTRPAVTVEIDTPNGRVRVQTPDYSFKGIGDSLTAKIHATPAGVKQWHKRALEAATGAFKTHLDDFHDRFGDVRASDFDWVWHNTRNGLKPSQIIGTVDPTTGRQVTQNMIDAMKWFDNQPFMKDLRKASAGALGVEGKSTLGYLPHSDYDPSNLSFEEVLPGRLWQHSTGRSVLDDNGNYKGFGGDLQSRYKTFASNMLWDARNKDILTAKMMETAELDGKTITPEQARKAVDGELDIRKGVENDSSTVKLTSAIEAPGDGSDIDWEKIDSNIKEQSQKSKLGKAYHEVLGDVYSGYNTARVLKKGNVIFNSFRQLSDFLKNTVIEIDGNEASLYDWGGADLVYAWQNATDIANRMTRNGENLRDMLTEYITNHSHRPAKYVDPVVDKIIARIGEIPGEVTKGDLIDTLAKSFKSEAFSRIKKWLVCAKYDDFSGSTKNSIDRFLFNHLQEDVVVNSSKLKSLAKSALDTVMGARYRALFYGNFKNALLQTSELNRFFYTFKWGDVGSMAKRMATDPTFRARVDDYADAILPRSSRLDAEVYQNYGKVADSAKVEETQTVFQKVKGKAGATAKTVDDIALYPIETAENFKNRMMISALVAEADNLGLHGDEALRHIRNRFERVALAADEMGRIGLANIHLARPFLFLQNFQIRELGMNYYNIKDLWTSDVSVPKKVYQSFAYLTKLFGAKVATTLIMARLGYAPTQTLGIDPFGLLEENRYLDPEDMEWQDYIMSSPLFVGGMTSLISEFYFMARQAYEESQRDTIAGEVDERINNTWGLAEPEGAGGWFGKLASGFIPGSTFANRLGQMNEMMDTGWAISSTGNKMYTAPTDPLDIAMGYLFGRNATRNAQQYNQTYGDNLLQTLGRINPFREYNEFDPIDTKNFTDWFKGDGNDEQQFRKGYYYFNSEKKRIVNEYESVINDSYASTDEITEAKNAMNQELESLFDRFERFVEAYERKNGTIEPYMVNMILRVLNTSKRAINDDAETTDARSLQGYNNALNTYSRMGFSPVGTYTGPTESNPDKEVKYQGSPQWRAAVSGYKNMGDNAVAALKQADLALKPLRDKLKNSISEAYESEDWDTLEAMQEQYLEEFDKQVAPIIAIYGTGVFNSTNFNNQLSDMLSTGSQKRSANLIPSEHYKKNKYGKYQSMPYESVDVGKWAKKRYSDEKYNRPSYNSTATSGSMLNDIKRLDASGYRDLAKAKARQLLSMVQNQTRSVSSQDYKWLTEFINK